MEGLDLDIYTSALASFVICEWISGVWKCATRQLQWRNGDKGEKDKMRNLGVYVGELGVELFANDRPALASERGHFRNREGTVAIAFCQVLRDFAFQAKILHESDVHRRAPIVCAFQEETVRLTFLLGLQVARWNAFATFRYDIHKIWMQYFECSEIR